MTKKCLNKLKQKGMYISLPLIRTTPPTKEIPRLLHLVRNGRRRPRGYWSIHRGDRFKLYMYKYPSWCTCMHFTLGISRSRVQRLMLSKGAKRWICDNITRFPQYFWQMTITRSEDISKDDTSILNLLKNCKFPQTLRYSFNRGNSNCEILYWSVCDAKTFNDQTEYTRSIPIHVSTPCNRFIPTILQNYCDMVKYCSFCSFT